MKVRVTKRVHRGAESWNFLYMFLGFSLTIESAVVEMITPLCFPKNVLLFVAVATITGWLFIDNAWFQNKLIGWKHAYEGKGREIN